MERYSIKNQQRILKTHPAATDVRPRTDWLETGRRVIPGAVPAFVLAPIAWDPTGTPTSFKECPVYDIRQTEEIVGLEPSIADVA